MSPARYFGLYRGTVVDNADPERRGRVRATCPQVAAVAPLGWAMPCVPLAGMQMGAVFVPQIGAGIWLQFEAGNPDHPVWVGGFWNAAAEMPAGQGTTPAMPILLQGGVGAFLTIGTSAGAAGGLTLEANGATIRVDESGITIENGKGASIVLAGPSVIVNGGALEVT